eukprot:1622019-Alexandrium_andersonii.AAC.1
MQGGALPRNRPARPKEERLPEAEAGRIDLELAAAEPLPTPALPPDWEVRDDPALLRGRSGEAQSGARSARGPGGSTKPACLDSLRNCRSSRTR